MSGPKQPASRPRPAGERGRGSSPAGRGVPRATAAGPGDARASRAIGLRLARVHLRMGSLSLARAELEAYAGRAVLDDDALLDLAEARWRTGDLAGAGEAANAFLATDRGDPLALVIAAEATASLGRPGEARRLAARALEAMPGSLEPLFAGMPRSLIWPTEAVELGAEIEPARPATRPPGDQPSDAGRAAGDHGEEARGDVDLFPAMLLAGPARPPAAAALAAGRLAAERGEWGPAAVRLGLALRLDPRLAHAVLEALGDRVSDDPVLALLAGDALRLQGRESEALAAFEQAMSAMGADDEPAVPPDAALDAD